MPNTHRHTHTRHVHTDTYMLWMQTNMHVKKWCTDTRTMGAIQTATQRNWQGDKVERMTAERKNKQDRRRGRSRRVRVIFYPLFNQVLSLRSTFILFRETWEPKSWLRSDKENSLKHFSATFQPSLSNSQKHTKSNCRGENVRSAFTLKTRLVSALAFVPFV